METRVNSNNTDSGESAQAATSSANAARDVIDRDRMRGQRLAISGLLISLALGFVKLVAGLIGNSFALVADSIESFTDIVSAVVIWGGLHISAKPATDQHPYGYGKAESLAAVVVAAIVLAAGVGIALEASINIRTPHAPPAAFTLIVLALVVIVKEGLFRVLRGAGQRSESSAILNEAWHHRADAITSAAAFIGVLIAVIGGDTWAAADDWAALFAAVVIVYNAVRLFRLPVRELLDAQEVEFVERVRVIAESTTGVIKAEKALARKSGTGYWMDMHIWVDGDLTVRAAHEIAHDVKNAIRRECPQVLDVLIHIEPPMAPNDNV